MKPILLFVLLATPGVALSQAMESAWSTSISDPYEVGTTYPVATSFDGHVSLLELDPSTKTIVLVCYDRALFVSLHWRTPIDQDIAELAVTTVIDGKSETTANWYRGDVDDQLLHQNPSEFLEDLLAGSLTVQFSISDSVAGQLEVMFRLDGFKQAVAHLGSECDVPLPE